MDKQDSFYVMFKHAFEKLGLTHQEVSKEFSVSHVTIDRWLENKGKPHPYMQIPLIAWLHNKLKDIMVFKKYGCPSKQINTCEGCSEIECLENLKEQGFCLVCGEKVCGAHIPDAKNDIDESIQVRIRYLKDEKNDICDALEQHVEPAFRKKLNEELREVQVKLRQLHKDETKELNQEKLKPLSHGEAIKLLGTPPVFYFMGGEVSEEDFRYGQRGPGWYFYEENWAYIHGPYENKGEANEACKEYARNL